MSLFHGWCDISGDGTDDCRSAELILAYPVHEVRIFVVPRQLAADISPRNGAFRGDLDGDVFAGMLSAALSWHQLSAKIDELISFEEVDAERIDSFCHLPDYKAFVPARKSAVPYERYRDERGASGVYRQCASWTDYGQSIIDVSW